MHLCSIYAPQFFCFHDPTTLDVRYHCRLYARGECPLIVAVRGLGAARPVGGSFTSECVLASSFAIDNTAREPKGRESHSCENTERFRCADCRIAADGGVVGEAGAEG